MNRRRAINRKRKCYGWRRKLLLPRYLLKDILPDPGVGEQLPVIEEWEAMIPVGREIT